MSNKQIDPILLCVHEKLQSVGILKSNSPLILAVSGGVDSMVLLHSVLQFSNEVVIAHCNFELRGEESDKDESLVKAMAEFYNLTCEVRHFDTQTYANQNQLSIQQAARELRYRWFEELRILHQADWILTAHHADDQLETFFINLSRGSGIAGLTGIPDQSNHLLRPLLAVTKAEILAYANKYTIQFREDASNRSEKYLRNSIRLKLIPFLDENYKGLKAAALESISYLKQVNQFYQEQMSVELQKLIKKTDQYQYITCCKLIDNHHIDLILHEWLKVFGFTKDNLSKASSLIRSGKTGYFISAEFKLYIESDAVYLQEKREYQSIKIAMDEHEKLDLNAPISLHFQVSTAIPVFKDEPAQTAFLDFDKTGGNLELRNWIQGDSFFPLGMSKAKKISDYFIDNKFSRFKKENTFLLTANGNIVWIVGERISDNYKITEDTGKVLTIHVDKSFE